VVNPMLAVVISFFLPGLGSVYAGKTMIGIVLFVIWLIALVGIYFVGVIAYILYIIIWLYGMYDAYITAKTTV
jgi:hypothetical protein